ncbi:MAG: hypothetical protein F6K10_04745 [Moorea sp. SIO2B7]|nr:hypothetical protein [Moorena sp. SIO2B7]
MFVTNKSYARPSATIGIATVLHCATNSSNSLALTTAVPLTRHPAAVYLSTLGRGPAPL